MTNVLRRLTCQDEQEVQMWFHCPGCKRGHAYRIKAHPNSPNAPVWEWNGSMTNPTFTPSLLVDGHAPERRCHCFVTDGRIRFLNDCFHDLKGQTVDMLPDDDD